MDLADEERRDVGRVVFAIGQEVHQCRVEANELYGVVRVPVIREHLVEEEVEEPLLELLHLVVAPVRLAPS